MGVKAEDKAIIKAVLTRRKIFAASIATLLCEEDSCWTEAQKQGALVLLQDPDRQNALFLVLVALKERKVGWEEEIYLECIFKEDVAGLLSFEGEKKVFGLLFDEKGEGKAFLTVLKRKMEEFYLKREPELQSYKKITLEEIGEPENFQHLSHVGFNKRLGCFDIRNIPPGWKSILNEAGVTTEDLKQKEVAEAVVSFINKNIEEEDSTREKHPGRLPPPKPLPSEDIANVWSKSQKEELKPSIQEPFHNSLLAEIREAGGRQWPVHTAPYQPTVFKETTGEDSLAAKLRATLKARRQSLEEEEW